LCRKWVNIAIPEMLGSKGGLDPGTMADDLRDLPEFFQSGTGIAPGQAATTFCLIFSSSSSTNKPILNAL
jgi:hypothetical protein